VHIVHEVSAVDKTNILQSYVKVSYIVLLTRFHTSLHPLLPLLE